MFDKLNMKLGLLLPALITGETVEDRLTQLEKRVQTLEKKLLFGDSKKAFSYGLYYCQNENVPGIDTQRYNFKGKGKIPVDFKFHDTMHEAKHSLDYAGMAN